MTSAEMRAEFAALLGLREGEDLPDGEALLADLGAEVRQRPLFGDSR